MKIFLLLTCSILFSCNPTLHKVDKILEKAGKNRAQLEMAINHYKELGDKEKLKAAYFLIANMENKSGRYGAIVEKYYPIFELLQTLHKNKVDNDTINKIVAATWDSIELVNGAITEQNFKYFPDYQVITADYLIDNIDMAFKVWKEKPWAQHLNFNQFCEYILPYRVFDEPIQFFRKRFYDQFSWLEDSLKNKNDPKEACLVLNLYLAKKFKFCTKLGKCPILGVNQLYDLCGGICEHRYCMIANIMRSVGIPVALDKTTQRNDETGGHSWLVLIDTNGKSRAFNGGEPDVKFPDSVYTPISKGTATKVFRKKYENQKNPLINNLALEDIPTIFNTTEFQDVTSEYDFPQTTLKFNLEVKPTKKMRYVYLCCFGYSTQIVPIAYTETSSNEVKFNNVGTKGVYFCAFLENNQWTIACNPSYVIDKKNTYSLAPIATKSISVKLTRKYYPQQYLFRMSDYSKWLIGAKLQAAANKDFHNLRTLYTIDSSYSHFVEKEISNNHSYRFYRLLSADTSAIRLAELDFVVDGVDTIKNKSKKFDVFGKVIQLKGDTRTAFKNAFDGDVSTNFNADPGSWVAIDYKKPVKVNKVRFLVRNDLNVIEVGDVYELFYFDMGWQSLGQTQADKNYLVYKNVPDNALLLLRDLSKGREERIFIYKDEKQIWL